MAIADLPYTCAHEGGHLLTVSTRDSEPAAGVQEKRHDPGPYPIYWWTNTTQLLLGGKVATPGYFTDDKNEANYNIRHYNFALKHHTKRHMAESIMQAGAGQYKWLRHEDWEVANKKAKDFE